MRSREVGVSVSFSSFFLSGTPTADTGHPSQHACTVPVPVCRTLSNERRSAVRARPRRGRTAPRPDAMGAGASALELPAQLDKATAKKLAGSKFDEAKFNRAAAKNGKVSREDFLKAAGGTTKTALNKGGKKGTGSGKKGAGGLIAQAKAEAAASSSAEPPAAAAPPPAAPPAEAPAEAAPAPPPVPAVVGEVKVRYSHYCKPFKVVDGVLQFRAIDEEYCISFVYKGAFVAYLLPEAAGSGRVPKLVEGAPSILPDGGRFSRDVDEDGEPIVVGQFSGVALADDDDVPRTYQLFVEEDEAAELAARGGAAVTTYRGTDAADIRGATSASQALTAELKTLSTEELKGQSERYKALVEARDLEDCLFGAG